MKPVLEVCTHSVESAVSAERGGFMCGVMRQFNDRRYFAG